MTTLKLGTETASITNYLLSGTNGQPEPEIGMGATILMWTDRHAATIVAVRRFKGGGAKAGQVKEVDAQEDIAIRIDDNGMSEVQKYEFKPDPEAPVVTYRKNKSGAFVSKGGRRLRVGDRSSYHDYSF